MASRLHGYDEAAMAAKKEGDEAAIHSLAPIALAAKKEGAAVTEAGMVLKKALIDLQAANAKLIEDGVNSLKKEGVTAFITEIVKNVTAPPSSRNRGGGAVRVCHTAGCLSDS